LQNGDVRRSAFSVRRSAFGVQRSAFSVRRSAFSVQRSAFSVRRSAFGVRRSAFGVQRSAFSVRRSAFSVQRSAFSVQRSAWRRVWRGVASTVAKPMADTCNVPGSRKRLPSKAPYLTCPLFWRSTSGEGEIAPGAKKYRLEAYATLYRLEVCYLVTRAERSAKRLLS
jgi:hypothetical protein